MNVELIKEIVWRLVPPIKVPGGVVIALAICLGTACGWWIYERRNS